MGGEVRFLWSLHNEKVMIRTRLKVVNCGEDGDDMYNFKSR